jgi:para-aminobenzoate synthetase component 1
MMPRVGADRQPTGLPMAADGGRARRIDVPEVAGADVPEVAARLADLPGLAILESARPGRRARWTYVTADPVAVVTVPGPSGATFGPARAMLARMGGGGTRGPGGSSGASGPSGVGPGPGDAAGDARDAPPFAGGLVGYIGYDLGRELERIPSIAAADQHLPVLRLGLHDWVVAIDRRTGRVVLAGTAVDGDDVHLDERLADVRARLSTPGPAWPGTGPNGPVRGPARLADPAPAAAADPAVAAPHPTAAAAAGIPRRFASGLDRAAFVERVGRVRDAIAAGAIYQANLARRLEAPFSGDPRALFALLRAGDPAPFAAYLDLGPDPATGAPRAIVSASPEPFLSVDAGGRVATDPIKGTRPRGATRVEDRALAAELLASEKDRAENVMIVDVLRNDLGRVCEPGSVRVPRLCRLERTRAVQHLVSTVVGDLAPGRDALDLLAASFPGGSITGAPKIRAMAVIEELEPVRRGPYCGAALWIGADGAMGSSILIRTFVADGARLTLHVGGGITRRSDPLAEWEETRVKARGPLRAIGADEA